MRKLRILIVMIALFIPSKLWTQEEDEKILQLNIGHPQLKNKTMQIHPDKIYSAQNGDVISFEEMISEMKSSRLVYVGETHNSLPMHNIQAQIIKALFEQKGNLAVGLEMYTKKRQAILNKWSLGILSTEQFIQEAEWYVAWNFNFGYYANIFETIREYNIPLYALNAPRELISKIRMQGWDKLTSEEKNLVPKPDLSHDEHRTLIRTIFENMEMPHAMKGAGLEMVFEGLYRAQSAWDEVMAANIIEALLWNDLHMVVLAGSGHFLYNLGINRRAYEKTKWPFKTVICVVIPEGKSNIRVSRSLADYVWGIKAEKKPKFPSIGLKLKKFDGLNNLVIEQKPIDGAALNAGFEKGDLILYVDGQEFAEINALRIYLAQFKWDDSVVFKVLRSAKEKEIELKFEYIDQN